MEISGNIFEIGAMVARAAHASNMAYSHTLSIIDSAQRAADQTAKQVVNESIDLRVQAAGSRLGSNIDVMV